MGKVTTAPAVIRVKVRAIKDGYYGDAYRHVGSVFVLEGPAPDPSNPKDAKCDPKLPRIFSKIWMQVVEEDTPERNVGSQEALRRHHDQVNADKFGIPTGDRDVLNG
jgi:hypothetical protein